MDNRKQNRTHAHAHTHMQAHRKSMFDLRTKMAKETSKFLETALERLAGWRRHL